MNSIATIATSNKIQADGSDANRNSLEAFEERRFQVFTDRQFDRIEAIKALPEAVRFEMKVVASVLPFRVNEYVINELIRWDKVPNDPIYQLVFPQRGMLREAHFEKMAALHRDGADRKTIQRAAKEIRDELNPHPAGQMEMNMPAVEGETLDGVQHKYRETVLFFPAQGQTCHSYCTFCFRWAQFVGDKDLKMASTEAEKLHAYLREHQEVSDLLVTGGDPMVMKTKHLVQYLEPLLAPEFDHIRTIRIGTKALTFWPHRFVTDNDADELIDLMTRLVEGGKHLAIMAHYNHWQEITTAIAERAIARIRGTGAEIRAQGPLIKHVNDDPDAWARLWQRQVELGIIPYYLFVERDTGAKNYFELPLAQAVEIYRQAVTRVSGLARTARGPSMSAGPGKVEVQGVAEISGEKVFVLRFLQGRNPDWAQRPFFAKYSATATWLHELEPAFGEQAFFFEAEYEQMKSVGA